MSKDPYNHAMTLIADAMDEVDKEKPSRERSLVQTKLDEAMMWADKGRSAVISPINLEHDPLDDVIASGGIDPTD